LEERKSEREQAFSIERERYMIIMKWGGRVVGNI